MILLPAIDILDGKAVRLAKGDFDAKTESRRGSARGRAALGRRRRPGAARRRPRRRAQRRAPRTSSTSERIAHGGRCAGPGRRRPAHDGARRDRDRAPARRGSCSAPRRTPTSTSSTRCSPTTATGSSCRSTSATASSPRRAGPSRPRSPSESVIERLGGPGSAAVRVLEHRARRDARGPGSERGARGSPRPFAAASSTRAASPRSTISHALVALRQVNLAGVIVGKALYERRFERRRRRRRPRRRPPGRRAPLTRCTTSA